METINNDILSDGFRLEGSWASDLKDALKKMNESTTILEIDSSELIMYSIIDIPYFILVPNINLFMGQIMRVVLVTTG